jgi:hypothetical protein
MIFGKSSEGIAGVSLRRIALFAGIGYLVIFITGIFANFFVLENLLVQGDAVATVRNIAENELLFRIGIVSFIVMVIFDAVLAWALYILLKPVNRELSLLSAWLRLVNATIFGVALYNLISILNFLSDAEYLVSIGTDHLNASIMVFISAFDYTWLLGLVFFGIHLLVLGYLIVKSDYIPKFIGIFLLVASAGYLIDSFAHFMLSNYEDYESIFSFAVIVPGVIGELSFTIWLLIKGRNIPDMKCC